MSDWQPIESAPKDTAVLTYGFGYEVAYFSTDLDRWVVCWNDRPIKPYYWTKLPSPPVTETQSEG